MTISLTSSNGSGNAPAVDWAQRIGAAWQSSIDGIFETGRLLIEAKAALPHGGFQRMIGKDLPFSPATARRLMAVARDQRLAKRAHANVLPPSWATLYELTKLDDAALEAGLTSGAINPDMYRSEVAEADATPVRGIGTRSASAQERGLDFYPTPPEAVRALLAVEDLAPTIWEPACGNGAISTLLEEAGYGVILSDIEDRACADRHGEVQAVVDFLKTDAAWLAMRLPAGEFDIVTNPPFGIVNAFIAHALRRHRPRKMAMLLNLNAMCGTEDPDRNFWMDEHPPARIHVFARRLPMMHRDGWDGPRAGSQMNTAWFVWERDFRGPTVLNRVDWREHCLPLEGRRPTASPEGAAEAVGVTTPAATPTGSVPAAPGQSPASPQGGGRKKLPPDLVPAEGKVTELSIGGMRKNGSGRLVFSRKGDRFGWSYDLQLRELVSAGLLRFDHADFPACLAFALNWAREWFAAATPAGPEKYKAAAAGAVKWLDARRDEWGLT